MKLTTSCAVICLINALICTTGPSSMVHGKPLSGYLTKRYVLDQPRDLDSEESSEENSSSEESSEESGSSEASSEESGSSEESSKESSSSEASSEESGSSEASSEESGSSEESSKENCSSVVVADPTCPSGWSQNGTSCYLFVTSPATWGAAQNNCQALDSYLVEITSPQESDFFKNSLIIDEKMNLDVCKPDKPEQFYMTDILEI